MRRRPNRVVPSFKGFRSSGQAASAVGRANRKTHTQPEVLLRRALWRKGIRYRLYASDVPGRPDLVIRSLRVAIFVDGDFWHGRDWPKRRKRLQRGANASYWMAKIARNRARDRLTTRSLQRDGWNVIRVWELDVRRDPEAAAARVAALVIRLRYGGAVAIAGSQ